MKNNRKLWFEDEPIQKEKISEKKPRQKENLGSITNPRIIPFPKINKHNVTIKQEEMKTHKTAKLWKALETFNPWWDEYEKHKKKVKAINKFISENELNNPFNFPEENKEEIFMQHVNIHEKGWEEVEGIFNEHDEIYNEVDDFYEMLELGNHNELLDLVRAELDMASYDDIYSVVNA